MTTVQESKGQSHRMLKPTRPGERIQLGVGLATLVLVVAFTALTVTFAYSSNTNPSGKILATAFLLFVASAAVGSLAGFLFGLPRARFADQMSAEQTSRTTARRGKSEAAAPPRSAYFTNSNLIKVSDWITTIVVGLTLVNLGKIVPAFGDLGAVLSRSLGGTPQAGTMGISIVIVGLVSGFVLFYLWTAIQYRSMLEDSEASVEVPIVDDANVGVARERIESVGLRMQAIPADATAQTPVSYQSPEAGTRAAPGSAVTVTVNRGG